MLIYTILITTFYITCTLALPHKLNKRQVVTPLACGNEPNTVSICSPSESSTWYNNTNQEFTWKYNNPKFDQYSTVDLYVLKKNESGDYTPQKTWTGLQTSVGVSVQLVDDSWFPSSIPDNSPNITWTMYAYVVGAGYDIQSDLDKISTSHNYFPAPQSFTLIQNARNTTTTKTQDGPPAGATSSSAATSTALAGTNASNHFPNWAIAVICIAGVLVIAAAAGLIWVKTRQKNKKAEKIQIDQHPPDEKQHPMVLANNNTKADLSSIHSSTPMIASQQQAAGIEDVSTITDRSALGINNRINQSSGVLSSTDALLIADTFRHLMRRPEWNEDEDDDRSLKREGTHSESLETHQ
ncbi:hypothetical protein K501DRAFT_331205 [Backusella circina FSU 941]|nr:hypothetical protein K501DRAFT_331205 [Backusella circina FSU 941]